MSSTKDIEKRIAKLEAEAAAIDKQRGELKKKAADLAESIAREYRALADSLPDNPIPPQRIG